MRQRRTELAHVGDGISEAVQRLVEAAATGPARRRPPDGQPSIERIDVDVGVPPTPTATGAEARTQNSHQGGDGPDQQRQRSATTADRGSASAPRPSAPAARPLAEICPAVGQRPHAVRDAQASYSGPDMKGSGRARNAWTSPRVSCRPRGVMTFDAATICPVATS